MKIAFIIGYFPSLSETFILNQITGLLDMGHDVDIFAWPCPGEVKVHHDVGKYQLMERAHYFSLPAGKIRRVSNAAYLTLRNFSKAPIKILKSLNIVKYRKRASTLKLFHLLVPFLEKDFDIIHCHYGNHGLIGSFLKEVGVSGKLVTSFHGADVNSYPRIAGEDVYRNLFERGDLFTTNTNFTKQQVIKLGCDEDRIVVLPMGIRIEKFTFSIREVEPEKPVRIVTVGRLVEKKGHEYALRAVAKIVQRHKDIEYLIAGDGPLRGRLESLCFQLDIGHYVRFLGATDQNEVLQLYQQAHIFVLPSITASDGDREGQALVLQEAQATGLPVVSTWHNGIPEGILEGRSGFLVPEKDVDALAERIEYLIRNSDKWAEMGRSGRAFVENKYDIVRLNRQLEQIYANLLEDNESV